jgi:hypothetical protein
MTVAAVASSTSGSVAHAGCHLEKRRVSELGLLHQKSTLAEVIEREGRKHEREPAATDRSGTEVAHVGIQGLTTGHGEEDAAEDDEASMAAGGQKVPAMPGIEGGEDFRPVKELRHTEHREADKPQTRDRAEKAPHIGRAEKLHRKQHDEDHDGDAHDEPLHVMIPRLGRQRIRRSRAEQSAVFETLHGAQHGNGRCDDAIAKQQRGTEQAEQHDHRASFQGFAHAMRGQRHEREHAALAFVVRPQDEDEILHADEQNQRPQHQRDDAEDVLMRRGDVMRAVRAEALLQRVDRRGADVPKHHAERRDDEGGGGKLVEAGFVVVVHDNDTVHPPGRTASERATPGS